MAVTARPQRRNGVVFLLLLATALLLRLPVLFDSIVDWDESLYLLISEEVLSGQLPYEGSWDHKPPLIYWLFALAQLLLGGGIVSIRLLGTLSVAIGAYSIFRLHRELWPQLPGPWVGALAYTALCTVNGGLATNTEIVFGAAVLQGLLHATLGASTESLRARTLRFLASGCAFGLAFGTKFVVGFDLLAFALVFAALLYGQRLALADGIRRYVEAGSLIGGAFVATLLLQMAPYWWTGQVSVLIENSIVFNWVYAGVGITGAGLLRGANALLAFSGALVGAAAVLVALPRLAPSPGERALLGSLFAWLGLAGLSVAAQGRFFDHHLLQLLPPLCLLFSFFAGSLLQAFPSRQTAFGRTGLAVLLLAFVFFSGPAGELGWRALRLARNAVHGDFHRDDVPRHVAAAIRAELQPGDSLYVYNYQHVVYHLAGGAIPTRFPFSLHLLSKPGAAALEVDQSDEIRRIMDSRPRFVVVKEGPGVAPHETAGIVWDGLAAAYEEAARFALWQREPNKLDGGALYRVVARDDAFAVVYRLREAPELAVEATPVP
ncbi:MAG: glycosyltransferase family 39 protein [Proteobacteria bacterium]|nr:glycosyltransferase family 39 protein [Pseudomonadota bacterium]